MNLKEFNEGWNILKKYYPEDEYVLGAEHDEIWVAKTPCPVTEDEFHRLIELGWMQEGVYDEAPKYDPELDWHCFV